MRGRQENIPDDIMNSASWGTMTDALVAMLPCANSSAGGHTASCRERIERCMDQANALGLSERSDGLEIFQGLTESSAVPFHCDTISNASS